jgi:hypothetical protein
MSITQVWQEAFVSWRGLLTMISTAFPDGLIEETLRTLALLFPQSDQLLTNGIEDYPRASTLIPNLSYAVT